MSTFHKIIDAVIKAYECFSIHLKPL